MCVSYLVVAAVIKYLIKHSLRESGGLNGNVPDSFRHFNTLSLVGIAVWLDLGGVVWLEEVHH